MLRINVHDNPESLTFELEGRLAEVWVEEAKRCWQLHPSACRRGDIRVDLAGVTFIDIAGKALLAAMHAQGVELIAASCMTKAIVAEINQASVPERGARIDGLLKNHPR